MTFSVWPRATGPVCPDRDGPGQTTLTTGRLRPPLTSPMKCWLGPTGVWAPAAPAGPASATAATVAVIAAAVMKVRAPMFTRSVCALRRLASSPDPVGVGVREQCGHAAGVPKHHRLAPLAAEPTVTAAGGQRGGGLPRVDGIEDEALRACRELEGVPAGVGRGAISGADETVLDLHLAGRLSSAGGAGNLSGSGRDGFLEIG